MAQLQITKQTYAQYESHHYHMYNVGDIYQIGGIYMPTSLSTLAIAQGWGTSTASAATSVDIDPTLDTYSKMPSHPRKIVTTDGS